VRETGARRRATRTISPCRARRQTVERPSAGFVASTHDRPQAVKHYLGDLNAPQDLHELEKLVKIERWIGTKQERDKLNER